MPIPTDTAPPPAITGLVVNNAYDGRVNLWWDKSATADFDHYNIYKNETEMADVTGMEASQQIKDITICRYQVTGLEDGNSYYFAVTAVDTSGNEEMRVTDARATPAQMTRGIVDPDLAVDVYQSDMAWAGTTLFSDRHDLNRPRIIEVNMLGEIVWEYVIPNTMRPVGRTLSSAGDVELLENNNILIEVTYSGVYEIDRDGNIIWSYCTEKISHDVDRLPNGNTLFVWGMGDTKNDAQVTEVSPSGDIVWEWYAKDHFDKAPYDNISDSGWTHTNAVSRLPNGNTLISPRNFNIVVEVGPDGEVIATYGDGVFINQHDPEMLPNGNILLANQDEPHRAIEFDPETGEIVWQSAGFGQNEVPIRDANRLPNGNTLITGSTKIVEVTAEGEIVWQLILKGITLSGAEAAQSGFYKAERISSEKSKGD